jgi:hypothetical protein
MEQLWEAEAWLSGSAASARKIVVFLALLELCG